MAEYRSEDRELKKGSLFFWTSVYQKYAAIMRMLLNIYLEKQKLLYKIKLYSS